MTVELREAIPRFVAPMLLATADGVPDDDGWALEVKWDGMRAQARIEHGRLRVRSRRGVDWTQQFPELADLPPSAADRSLLLDCELVCFDSTGHPDFARLRARLARGSSQAARAAQLEPSTLIVFDVLHLDGRAVRRLPTASAADCSPSSHWTASRGGRRPPIAPGATISPPSRASTASKASWLSACRPRTWRADAPRARGASSSTAMWKH
jgi:ATP dependent DNA ligase domain